MPNPLPMPGQPDPNAPSIVQVIFAALTKPDGVLQGLLRHALTAVGGYLIGQGWMAEAQMESFIGLGLVLVASILSWIQKRSAAKYIGTALEMKAGSTRAALDAIV